MIEIYSCTTNFGLRSLDFVNTLYHLRLNGNKFMILEGKIGMLSALNIDFINKDIFNWISRNIIDYENRTAHCADIFIDDGDLLYIINHESNGWENGNKLELGIITTSQKRGQLKLLKFSNDIINSIKTIIDKRRIRYYDLKWYVNGPNWEIRSRLFPEGKFIPSYLLENEVLAATLLNDNTVKECLINISKFKFYSPMLNIDKKQEHNQVMFTKLLEHNLISNALQIQCSKNPKHLKIILTDKNNKLSTLNNENCKICGNLYSDTNLTHGFSLSQLGKKMIKGSNWMTISLTNCLHKNGIPLDKIIWSLSEDSEEVDCIAEYKGKIWIFELKDKSFEAGNAHPFIYRAIKYKADKIVIITSDKVSPDAKKIFKDIARKYRAALDIDEPIFIEGLENMDKIISNMVKKEVQFQIDEKHKELRKLTLVDFSPIFNMLFSNYLQNRKI